LVVARIRILAAALMLVPADPQTQVPLAVLMLVPAAVVMLGLVDPAIRVLVGVLTQVLGVAANVQAYVKSSLTII
jgi:hypothetical protein